MGSFDFSTNFSNKGFGVNNPFTASANGDSPFMGSVFNSPFNSPFNSSFNKPFNSPFNSSFSGFGNNGNGSFLGNSNSFMNINNMSFMQAIMRAQSKNKDYVSTDSSINWNKNFTRVEFNEKENKKIDEISQRLGCNPNDLKAVIYAESGGNTRAVNPSSGATGLIQFMPSTAKGLGTTTEALKNMTAENQLDYVEKHLQRAKASAGFAKTDKIDSGTLYSLVFLPAFAKRDVLCQSDSIYYKANSGLDKNKDGRITKSDLAAQMKSFA